MPKRVVVIASGETERRSLPHLVRFLEAEDIQIVDIRRPDGHKALSLEMAERLIKAAWFAPDGGVAPDKFVILVDADGTEPEEILQPFREDLPSRLGSQIKADLQFAFAQWHLESWYFADAKGLRQYLGRDLGSIDPSQPDQVMNPKLHLKHLLGDRAYTAIVSEEICRTLSPENIVARSPSFLGLVQAIRNGSDGNAGP